MTKEYKGEIKNWRKKFYDNGKYNILGTFVDHPQFKGMGGHTSLVSFNEDTGEVETLNSRYKVVGDKLPYTSAEEEYRFFMEMVKGLKDYGYDVIL